MNLDPRKKTIKIAIEDARMQYWLPALVLFVATLVFWHFVLSPTYMRFEIKAKQAGVFQVFVDEGAGYSEENSIKFDLDAERWVRLKIPLEQFGQIRSLRIDPVNNDGPVFVRKLYLKHPDSWTGNDLLEAEYSTPSGIRWQWNAKKHQLEIYPAPGNVDPQFYLPSERLLQASSDLSVSLRRIVVHGAAMATGVLIGVLFASFWVNTLMHAWLALVFPFEQIGVFKARYVEWVDSISMRFELINPTSCVAAGLFAACISFFTTFHGSFVQNTSERLTASLAFEIVEGSLDSLAVFAITDSAYRIEQSVFRSFVHGLSHQTFKTRLPVVQKAITHFRIDPMESEGYVAIEDIRVIRSDGKVLYLPTENWTTNDSLELDIDEGVFRLTGVGSDPYMVSPEVLFDPSLRATLPAWIVAPLFWFLVVSFGCLLYNRLITEGMTPQQIRTAAKSS